MTWDAKKYYEDKYKNDPEYKKKRLFWSIRWAKNNREKVRANSRRRYANRTPEQIKKQKQHVKQMRVSGKWKR